jgi:hypothetical protein
MSEISRRTALWTLAEMDCPLITRQTKERLTWSFRATLVGKPR